MAKLQVELAQLQYRLPRLKGLGQELSRTGAGIGTRGPGEQKLEIDRRRVNEKLLTFASKLKKRVKSVKPKEHSEVEMKFLLWLL